MNKRIFISLKTRVVLFLVTAIFFSVPMTVFADSDAKIVQYYAGEKEFTFYVSGLETETAEVMLAGTVCPVQSDINVYHDAEKFETIFLIDSSSSMKSFRDEIKDFLLECVDKKQENECYSIGAFSSNHTPKYWASEEFNQYRLEKITNELEFDYASTYIYDNLLSTLKEIGSKDDGVFRRIVLFTDGGENNTNGIAIDDVIDWVQENPVQIYTVTMQKKSKSNLEQLKNIARFSRITGAEDIRIVNGDEDAAQKAAVLTEGAKRVSCIRVTVPSTLMDGSKKTVRISDETNTALTDIRVPMVETPKETTTSVSHTLPASSPTAAPVTEDTPEPESKPDSENSLLLPIVFAAGTVVILALIIAILTRKKAKKPETINLPGDQKDEPTMMIHTGSGETQMLIENGQASSRSLVLRDIADSMKTFEVQLSTAGAVMGRSAELSHIVIDYDKSVSRRHCRIFLRKDRVYIEDLGSGNKTFVNGEELHSERVLENADEIKIGRTVLKVVIK